MKHFGTGLLIGLAVMAVGFAQGPQAQRRPQADRLQDLLVPPDLVMRNQQAIGLTAEQQTAILKEISTAEAEFTQLRWTLQREIGTLVDLLQRPGVDEATVLSQLDRVLDLESRMKRARFLMAFRVKSHLTDEQVRMLDRIRDQQRRRIRSSVAPERP
jgi:Spy/CpxP family protein refolding chaperone